MYCQCMLFFLFKVFSFHFQVQDRKHSAPRFEILHRFARLNPLQPIRTSVMSQHLHCLFPSKLLLLSILRALRQNFCSFLFCKVIVTYTTTRVTSFRMTTRVAAELSLSAMCCVIVRFCWPAPSTTFPND